MSVAEWKEAELGRVGMRRKGMFADDPLRIADDLKDIGSDPASTEHEIGRVEGDQKPQTPAEIRPKVFAVGEMVAGEHMVSGCEHFIR